MGIGSDPGLLFGLSRICDLIDGGLLCCASIKTSILLLQTSIVQCFLICAKLCDSLSFPVVLLLLCDGWHDSFCVSEGESCEGSNEEKLHLFHFYFFIIILWLLLLIKVKGLIPYPGLLRSGLSREQKGERVLFKSKS